MEVQSKARFVDTPPSAERGVTATLSRSEIEETLKSADGPALLTLDIARRRGDEGDVEAHTVEVEVEKPDLEQILRTATGDAIELRFDGTELEEALDSRCGCARPASEGADPERRGRPLPPARPVTHPRCRSWKAVEEEPHPPSPRLSVTS
jgi:hypothetical protein